MSLHSKCAHLLAGIGSKTIVVVFNLYFYMVSGSLLSSAQALNMEKKTALFDVLSFSTKVY